MTDAIYPQVRIVTVRLLNPETVERVMNLIIATGGVRRVILNGPRLPATITYGPAKGQPNPHEMRKTITIGDQSVELQVHVGTILLELENRDVIPAIRSACEAGFRDLPWYLQEGKFMKTSPSLVDYAKYGPDADKAIIGMTDPSSKSGPIIIQGTK
ncbi:MAG: methyl-coenzyme M reductase operon protein D [Methanomicrobiales archaeon]|nr:methyl-coenzyme M reductase operon protein D [Methanomicrobiales archaeon]